MTKALRLAPNLTLPLDSVSRTFGLLAVRGAGKSNTAAVMAEEMFKAQLPFVVIDPVGSWYGLRSSSAGSEPGLPIPIFGGKHGDVPLERGAGELVADLVVEKRLTCVLDLSRFESESDKKAFLLAFARRLYLKNENPLHLFLEEADDYCLTADTEVLTADGWMMHDRLMNGINVVAFDLEKESFSYEPIQRVIVREHHGEMVQLKTEELDCVVTPEHRAVVRRVQRGGPERYKKYPWSFCQADQVPTNVIVPVGGAPIGAGIADLSIDDCRILGWLITDGCTHSTGRNYLSLSQSYTTIKRGVRIVDEMRSVLSPMGVTANERQLRTTQAPQGKVKAAASIEFYFGAAVCERFRRWLGTDIHRIPRRILNEGSRDQLDALYLGLMEGDGTAYGTKWRTFYPGLNEKLADEFQELCLRLGIRTVKRFIPSNQQWHVGVSSLGSRSEHWVRRPTRTTYSGIVWDITVASGAFVCRRNGRTFVTGNCPQKPMRDEAQLLRAWENIVRRGRARGLGMTLITQRSAAINKMVLTQVETLFAMRTTGPQDIAAIEAWVKYHQAGLEVLSTLSSLEDGEAWVWSPHFLKTMSRHQIRRRATFDSGATPTNVRAKEARPPATLADIDLGSIQSQMAATIEKAKADDPRELRKQIADLKRQLAQGSTQAKSEPIRQEVPALTEKDRAILSTMSDRIHALSIFLNTEAEAIVESVRVKVAAAINAATADMLSLLANGADDATERLQQVGFNRVLDKISVIHPTTQATAVPRNPQARRVAPALAQATSSRPARLVSDVVGGNGLPKGSRKILTALAQYPHGRSKTQIAILTSYAHNGGGFNNYLSAMRSLGFIDGAGDRLVITDAGLAALGPYEELPSGRDLVEHWLRQLGKAERLILETLVTAHPRAMTKDAVAQATNYEANGGGFNNALSRLRALELIGGRGELRASEELFS